MKFSLARFSTTAALASLLATSVASAQTTPAGTAPRPASPVATRSAGTTTAVIDISQVFEKHERFQADMQSLKKQVEEFEGFLRGEQQKMQGMRTELEAYAPGSAQFKAGEEKMAKFQADLNVKMGVQRREFLEKEARVYFDTYNEVYQKISEFCDKNGIQLVLRFNNEEMKPEDRGSVLQGVNRAVVFQRNLNITKFIIDEVNRGGAGAGVGTTRPPVGIPAESATRPGGPGASPGFNRPALK